MSVFNRARVVDENFVRFVQNWDGAVVDRLDRSSVVDGASSLTGGDLIELLESMIVSRHLDLIAREMRTENKSFYTIGSSGHECNSVVGRVARHTDPAFLHYRSGGFMAERSRKVPSIDMVRDTVLSQVACIDEPISGGRHKVWGSKPLWVPPQTSTIASHLPKAVGTAMALQRGVKLGVDLPVPSDSIVVCNFGDATTNHATAQSAFNMASYAAYQRLPLPVLFVCEDNGIGISVHTADGWIATNYGGRPAMRYVAVDGLDAVEAFEAAERAVSMCRDKRVPVFLHLKVVRLLGHAGTDVELSYHSAKRVEAAEARDPVLATAKRVVESGLMSVVEVGALYEDVRRRCREAADHAVSRPKLLTAEEVMKPLAPLDVQAVMEEAKRSAGKGARVKAFGEKLPEDAPPEHMARQINRGLYDLMAMHSDMVVFGEDVAQKGGVYGLTKDLYKAFGNGRVFNTLLDETSILGLAQGFGLMGMLPFPEIQYLAYYHNAEDQIRGEACSLQFFSTDQFRNPMVVRVGAFGYQKGFGGHFHNDNSIAALRDIPSLIVIAPSRGDDAVALLRTATAMARVSGRVIAFLEPIALYMTRDLYEEGDGKWCTEYPAPGVVAEIGAPRVYHEDATDVCIITYANGVYFSLRAAAELAREHGVSARVVDLRWLNPLNEEAIVEQVSECGAVVVVDEGRRTGGIGEAIVACVAERCDPVPPVTRVAGRDTYVPLGPAARLVMPTEPDIVAGVIGLLDRRGAVSGGGSE